MTPFFSVAHNSIVKVMVAQTPWLTGSPELGGLSFAKSVTKRHSNSDCSTDKFTLSNYSRRNLTLHDHYVCVMHFKSI